ncbi:MAG: hypothetical protein MJ082_00270 [Clostridia bacterium]|nr:hypothetical protein [Clostridia bacterium]
MKVGKEAGFTCVAETAACGMKILLSGEILPPPSSFYARGKGELYRILSEIYHQ